MRQSYPMNAFEWISLIVLVLGIISYLADSFVVFYRDIKEALKDGRLDETELNKLEDDARLIVKAVLKLVRIYRSVT